ncbi:MAG TPA: alpha-L-arabinofuranosidase C-terminal domain-containing protein, partial [Terriglobales bacterium]|nr:alpha-L-arabinofuranosidase C-terminal domain-containing protein [Terriglobales bacterium]
AKAHEVEVLWEDVAPARVLSASVITGNDLKSSNSFSSPNQVVPQAFPAPITSGGKTRLELPARSYTIVQWSL